MDCSEENIESYKLRFSKKAKAYNNNASQSAIVALTAKTQARSSHTASLDVRLKALLDLTALKYGQIV